MFPQPKRAEARLKVRDRVRDRPAYESLSDLVLAVRAQGRRPARARGAGRTARTGRAPADRVSARRHPGCGGRRPGGAGQAVHTDRTVQGGGPVPDLAAQPGREHVPRHGRSPAPPPPPAARRGRRGARRPRCPRTWPCSASSGPSSRPCMANLSDDQRRVLVMKDVLQLSYEQIAADMSMPVGHGQVPRPPRPSAHARRHGARVAGGGSVTAPLDRDGIRAIIPHREPFLLLDEVTALEPGVRAAGRYLVKPDDWYLAGHFPGNPIMPGVLQVEALAQLGSVCGLAHPDFAGKLALFAGIDDVRFKRIVRPGRRARPRVRDHAPARADRQGRRERARRRRAGLPGDAHLRAHRPRGAGVITACRRGVELLGVGSFAPERVVTNDELALRVDTSDEWIASRTGIHERRIAADDESSATLGYEAARRALEMAGLDAGRPRADRRCDRQPRLLLPGHGDADRRAAGSGGRGRVRPVRPRAPGSCSRWRRRTGRSPPG